MAQFLYGVIDTQREKYKPIGAVNLCDTLELELQVEMNGKAMEFVKPEFEFLVLKDDDNKVRQLVDIIFEDNKIKIRCNEQVTTCPGKTKGQLIIKDNGRVSTCLFYFIVKDTIEGAIIRSITDVQILDDLEEYVVQGFANLDEFERRIIASDASIRKLNEDMIVAEKIRDEAEKKREELKNILETKLENGEFNGQQGLQGLPGKDGIDGINGQDGADGVTPNIQVGTVTTLEAGQQAIVTKRGTDAEPIFDFAIPQGVKGEKGDTPDMTAFEKKINAQYEHIENRVDDHILNHPIGGNSSLITRYVYNENKVVQPTALDVDTGIFTCSNHGLKEGQTVIPIPNGVSTVLNIHKELFTEFNKPLMVTSVTKDTFILKTKDSNIVSYSITDNSVADVEKYHFEQVNPVKVELNDIVSNNIKIIIHGVCGIGDMYFGITKDGVFHKSYNVIGLGQYEGAIALSSNATHAPFRPFRSEIEIKRTLLGFGFMFENQQYAIINRTITDKSISRKYGVIQYQYDTFNGIMLGSPVHTWIIVNGTTIEVYNMEE